MNEKPLIFIELHGSGYRNLATVVEEYARECGLKRMHKDVFQKNEPDFSRVAWVEFPFDQKFESVQEALDSLRSKCRRPDLALCAQVGRNAWVAATVAG